jgi:hypothetical protein
MYISKCLLNKECMLFITVIFFIRRKKQNRIKIEKTCKWLLYDCIYSRGGDGKNKSQIEDHKRQTGQPRNLVLFSEELTRALFLHYYNTRIVSPDFVWHRKG